MANKDDSIIRANQFGTIQRILLIILTLAIVALGMVASFLFFKNYQLRSLKTKSVSPEQISPF